MLLKPLLPGVRLHRNDARLPGTPDIVIPSLRAVIFVHGCFWHGHDCKRGCRVPKTRRAYWLGKVTRNRKRDLRNARALRRSGWRVFNVWECRLQSRVIASLARRLLARST